VQTFNEKIVCPRCDGNGLVYKSKIINLDLIIFICDECEAVWLDEEIRLDKFQDLTTFLESKGLTYNGAQIQDLGYDWKK
jgi:Zn-finger nucleic acid-binding protein